MRIEGNVDVKANIKEITQMLEDAAEAALDAAGMQAATLAKRELQMSPSRIDTGLLKNSITWALGGKPAAISTYSADNESRHSGKTPESGSYSGTAPSDTPRTRSVYVGTNVEYAIYVHEGSTLPSGKHIPPNRFLKNAVTNNRTELSELMKRILQSG